MGPAAVPELVDVRAEGHDSEAVFDAPDADPRVSMALWGWPDTESRLRWARRRFRMSLERLRLRHGQRSADADPRSLDVDGRDPPSRHASIGIGGDGDVHPHPHLRRGVPPGQRSRAGRPRQAVTGSSRILPRRCPNSPTASRSATGCSAASKRRPNRLPARDCLSGSDPRGRGRGCANAPGPEPAAGLRTAGSLPAPSE